MVELFSMDAFINVVPTIGRRLKAFIFYSMFSKAGFGVAIDYTMYNDTMRTTTAYSFLSSFSNAWKTSMDYILNR